MPLPRCRAAQRASLVDPPLCLAITAPLPSNLFSHVSQGSQSGPVFPLPASICRGDGSFPRDAAEVIYQTHHLYLSMQSLHMSSCREPPSRQHAGLRIAYGPDSRSRICQSYTFYGQTESIGLTGLGGHWKRAAPCASRVLVRDFPKLINQSL